jgi:hypothetical protein
MRCPCRASHTACLTLGRLAAAPRIHLGGQVPCPSGAAAATVLLDQSKAGLGATAEALQAAPQHPTALFQSRAAVGQPGWLGTMDRQGGKVSHLEVQAHLRISEVATYLRASAAGLAGGVRQRLHRLGQAVRTCRLLARVARRQARRQVVAP